MKLEPQERTDLKRLAAQAREVSAMLARLTARQERHTATKGHLGLGQCSAKRLERNLRDALEASE
jgi:hypothetical protein